MNPTETEITEASDACYEMITVIENEALSNRLILGMDKGNTIKIAYDTIYQIYQELGRL